MADDFSPIYKGDTGAAFAPQFMKNGQPFDLTGCTISMKLQNEADPEDIKVCDDNSWHIDDAVNGIAHFDYGTNDVNTVGTYNMYITIFKNSKPVHTDVKVLRILDAP